MYRAQSVADTLGSLGYLVAIVSSISFAMTPRAKFFQQLIRNIVFVCASVPYTILALYCARVARDNTQAPGDTSRYNSSAAAVSAIFLFFNVYVANSLRAVAIPALTSAEGIAVSFVDDFYCDDEHCNEHCIDSGIYFTRRTSDLLPPKENPDRFSFCFRPRRGNQCYRLPSHHANHILRNPEPEIWLMVAFIRSLFHVCHGASKGTQRLHISPKQLPFQGTRSSTRRRKSQNPRRPRQTRHG
jgi:Putative ER transporter, 6TM, N-terminal